MAIRSTADLLCGGGSARRGVLAARRLGGTGDPHLLRALPERTDDHLDAVAEAGGLLEPGAGDGGGEGARRVGAPRAVLDDRLLDAEPVGRTGDDDRVEARLAQVARGTPCHARGADAVQDADLDVRG